MTDKERTPQPEPIVERVIEPHPDVEGRAYSPPPPQTIEPEGKFAYTTPPDRPEPLTPCTGCNPRADTFGARDAARADDASAGAFR